MLLLLLALLGGTRPDAGSLHPAGPDAGIFSPVERDAGRLPPDAPGAPDAGGLNATLPSTWTLSARLPPGSPEREALLAELTAELPNDPRAAGEVALTRDEAQALLADPRAELVYGEKTVVIAAPSMLIKQRRDHLDMMKAFLAPERVEAGAAFARAHAPALDAAEKRHTVDREVIIAILMWETKLGTITGDWLAFNALTSQAFFAQLASAVAMSKADERRRTDAARQRQRVETIEKRAHRNLVALVRQCKAKGIDALAVKGSWAGALGYPQFMPDSLRWAEDGNGDGVIDLFNFDDAIASIGRYLAAHGWAKSHRDAVWGYNHEEAYVEGVLAYSAALEKKIAGPGPSPTTK